VKMMDIEDNMLGHLKSADYEGFIKLAMEFSDAVMVAGENKKLEGLFKKIKEKKVETIDKDENYTESYYNLYNELVG
jgi:starch synthase